MEAVLFNSFKWKKNQHHNNNNKKKPTAKGQQEQKGCNQIATKSCCPDLLVFSFHLPTEVLQEAGPSVTPDATYTSPSSLLGGVPCQGTTVWTHLVSFIKSPNEAVTALHAFLALLLCMWFRQVLNTGESNWNSNSSLELDGVSIKHQEHLWQKEAREKGFEATESCSVKLSQAMS